MLDKSAKELDSAFDKSAKINSSTVRINTNKHIESIVENTFSSKENFDKQYHDSIKI